MGVGGLDAVSLVMRGGLRVSIVSSDWYSSFPATGCIRDSMCVCVG